MYKIEWDKETGGVILNTRVTNETLGIAPRPVFYEELDLLGLDKLGWTYPHTEAPLMWAVNKQYYYRGQRIFEAKGANIYSKPTLEFCKDIVPMDLQPVDMKSMLAKTSDLMFVLENEAIEFIRDTFTAYSRVNRTFDKADSNQLDFEALAAKAEKKQKQKMAVVKQDCDSFDIMPLETAKNEGKRVLLSTKIDRFIASFSGGKDSQVVLDLCTRAIPPTDFEVIYSDTGYELPSSLELYDEVQRYYKERFPSLKFHIARNHESVLNYWDKIGTPSDTHRWCCSIMKTAPLYRMLKVEGNKQARVLTFDGVRAEESTRRSGYSRIGKGVKHSTVINASPILFWNSVEIFLYLFKYDLPINLAYRQGMTRVGCLICPFSSEWNDMISSVKYSNKLQPFLYRIESIVKKSGVSDMKEYIEAGNWKRRAGGREMKSDTALVIRSTRPHLVVGVKKNKKNILTWIPTIGKIAGNASKGEVFYKGKTYSYSIKPENEGCEITFYNTDSEPLLQGLIKRALYKATFCINCEACEVECPTGALKIIPEVIIDRNKCIHCHRCLNFHELGCIVANSLKITEQNPSKMKLIGYNNFGLNESWLDFFFKNSDTYFSNTDHGLNVKEQLPAFVKWMVHAEILTDTKGKNLSTLGKLLKQIYEDNPRLVWEVIWINLAYNSPIVQWYTSSMRFNTNFTESEVRELVKNDFPEASATTVKNVVYALFRTLKESPIGDELKQLESVEKLSFKREPYEELSREAIAYSVYKYADIKGIKNLRVQDLYTQTPTDGIVPQFGLPKDRFLKILRSLSSDNNRVLVAELNMGLDHITLRDDLTCEKALTILSI